METQPLLWSSFREKTQKCVPRSPDRNSRQWFVFFLVVVVFQELICAFWHSAFWFNCYGLVWVKVLKNEILRKHLLIHLIIQWFLHPHSCFFIQSFLHTDTHSFISFIHSFIHTGIGQSLAHGHSLSHSFIHFFFHSHTPTLIPVP